MNYPINLLQRELHFFQDMLVNEPTYISENKEYIEDKVKQLKKAIELLKNENN